MSFDISLRTIALSYIGLSLVAVYISKGLLRRSTRQGMSRNAKDLDGCLNHSILNGAPATDQMQRLLWKNGKIPHVAVIGAGVAGLRCADVLIQAGFNVTIYEARNRMGGRVHQVKSAGHLVDLGPNWVHGNVKSNPISKLAGKTKTVLHEWDSRQAVIDSEGHQMDDAEAAAYSEIVWEIVAKAFQYSDDYFSSIDPQKSLMDYFKEEVPKIESDPAKIAELLKMAQRWGAFVGDPIERQSLKFFFLEETIEDKNAFIAGTYQRILEEIAANALAHAKIHLGTEIQHIETRVSPNQGEVDDELEPKVSIYTASGSSQEFDEVVVTAPLGWLKAQKKVAFTPSLPPRLSEAIDNISYGHLEKCYVTFPSVFWHGNSNSDKTAAQFNLADVTNGTTPESPQIPNGTSTTSRTEPYPSFIHFQSPAYVPHPPDLAWNQECISLADLPGQNAHPTLLFYLFGPCATAMVDLIASLPPHSPAYNSALTDFFEPFYSKLPHYSPTNPASKPVAFLATQWQRDPFAGHGSYTNYQVGLEAGDVDIETMRHGCPERALWFAGEHTAPFIALGTTTGAYWAGEGVARRICRAYGVAVPAEVEIEIEMVGDDGVEDDNVVEVRLNGVENGMRPDVANLNGIAL
jgi:Flavin containing amine oxidoreductase